MRMTTRPKIRSADGIDLYATFYQGDHPRGVLIVSHGLGEHSDCYEAFARQVAAVPEMLDVLTFDYRGHGHSPGKRGVIRSYDDFLADLDAAIAWAKRERPDVPIYLFGHSNGGQVVLHVGLRNDGRIAGLVVSNPSLRIAAPVPRHKYAAAVFLRRFGPRVTLTSTVRDEDLTSDPVNLAARKADILRHSKISAPLFFGMVEGGASVIARAEKLRLPLLLIVSGKDPVVDPATTIAFFHRVGSPDKTLKIYPNMLHEPLNEIGRETVVEEIIGWLSRHLMPMPVGP
jgi:alpha-beta hydrolase superfamily lysophospholipase